MSETVSESSERPSPVALAVAAMPPALQKALAKELCPGERVEWVAQPEAADPEGMQRDSAWWFGGVTALTAILALMEQASPGAYFFAVIFGIVVSLVRQRHNRQIAYVATNQRCFQINTSGLLVKVRDLTDPLHSGATLARRDREQLRERIQALARTGGEQPASRDEVDLAHALESMKPHLRRSLEASLLPGEDLRWVYQPTLADHVQHAPVDLITSTLVVIAGVIALLALILATAGHFNPLPAAAALLLGTCAWGRVVGKVKGKVYALTDRRGLVVGRKGQVKAYSPSEMQQFRRTQGTDGRGNLAPANLRGEAFYGVRDVKLVDDLVKGRSTPDRSTALLPADAPDGRGTEPEPASSATIPVGHP